MIHMSALLNFYKILINEMNKLFSTVTIIVSSKDKNRKFSTINSYYLKKGNTFEDWKKIEDDYYKVGNDIRKTINSNVRY